MVNGVGFGFDYYTVVSQMTGFLINEFNHSVLDSGVLFFDQTFSYSTAGTMTMTKRGVTVPLTMLANPPQSIYEMLTMSACDMTSVLIDHYDTSVAVNNAVAYNQQTTDADGVEVMRFILEVTSSAFNPG